MRGKLILAGGSPSVWSHNTSYVGISGLHSETNPGSNARKKSLDNQYAELVRTIETMHDKDMYTMEKNRRHLEQSMLAYTDKVREIQKARMSLPTIGSPKFSRKDSSRYSSASSPYEHHVNDKMSISDGSNSSKHSVASPEPHFISGDMELLPPLRYRGRPRKMTYHGKELEDKVFNPNFQFRHHSISGNTLHRPATPQAPRQRKTCTISPPNPSALSSARRSTDSAYESMFGSDTEEYPLKHSPLPRISDNSDLTEESIVRISSFPDIKKEKEQMSKFVLRFETNDDASLKRKKSTRKLSVEKQGKEALEKEALAKKLEAQRKRALKKMQKKRKESKAEKAETVPSPEPVVVIKKENREVCQSFRYSVSMSELKKKPNPFQLSNRDFVIKSEMENGRIMNTLGAGVLSVVNIDELGNFTGAKSNVLPRVRQGQYTKHVSQDDSEGQQLPNSVPVFSRQTSVDPYNGQTAANFVPLVKQISVSSQVL